MYEVHVAVPRVDVIVHQSIFTTLTQLGISKHKYFYNVRPVRSPVEVNSDNAVPDGHDLVHPGSMSTELVVTYEEVRGLVLKAMEVLAKHGVRGNFEIEGLIGEASELVVPSIVDFPGFKQTQNSPSREIHLIWKRKREKLPSEKRAIHFFKAISGLLPHQLVDFGLDPVPTKSTEISRIVTLYQSTHEETLVTLNTTKQNIQELEESYAFDNNPLTPFPRPSRLVAERILLVGEPI